MRPDIVALLRSSDRAYVRQLIGMDPVAMFRWGILRATIRGMAAFNEAGRSWAAKTSGTLSVEQCQPNLNYAIAKQRLIFLFISQNYCKGSIDGTQRYNGFIIGR